MITSKRRGVAKHGVEGRTLVAALRTADAVVAVDLDNGPAGTLGDGAQVAFLVGGVLLVGRDAKVESGAAHGGPFVAGTFAAIDGIAATRKQDVSGRLEGLEIGQGNQGPRSAFSATISGRPVA
jgi:hypothetical protein